MRLSSHCIVAAFYCIEGKVKMWYYESDKIEIYRRIARWIL